MFKDRLKELRIERNITQEELGKQVQRTRSAITSYETGAKEPTFEVLILLSKYFDVTIDYLLGTSDVRKPKQGTKDSTNLYLRAVKRRYDALDSRLKKQADKLTIVLLDNLLALQSKKYKK